MTRKNVTVFSIKYLVVKALGYGISYVVHQQLTIINTVAANNSRKNISSFNRTFVNENLTIKCQANWGSLY